MDIEQVDVVVIGMGPGGEEAAGSLAEAGLSVVGVEARLVGGECPNWGCVPSKMMIRAAHLLAEARRIPGMAGSATVAPDWGPVAARIRHEATDNWDDSVAADRFVDKGGRLVRGRGRLAGPGRVEVTVEDGDVRSFAASRGVVLATGTTPTIPPIDGLDEGPYWTNREAIEATEVPGRLVVLGGGAIGVELAQTYVRFGSAVTVVESAGRLVAQEEPEAGELLGDVFAAEDIEVLTDIAARQVAYDRGEITVTLADGRILSADRLLVATGRQADPRAVGADTVGVAPDARSVPTDERMRVADGVWAVGDVTGEGAFTHVAVYQARIAVADILDRPHPPASYRALPRVTFTDPEIGSVGLTEAGAREKGISVLTGSTPVPSTARGWIHKAGSEGVIKLVADAERGVLVGATAAGPSGGEVLGLLALAVHAEIPLTTLRSMIYAYPTFHRGIEDALRGLGE